MFGTIFGVYRLLIASTGRRRRRVVLVFLSSGRLFSGFLCVSLLVPLGSLPLSPRGNFFIHMIHIFHD